MRVDVVQAAQRLGRELGRLGVQVASVGADRRVPEIIVYTLDDDSLAERMIPEKWDGFPVRKIPSSRITPA